MFAVAVLPAAAGGVDLITFVAAVVILWSLAVV